MKKIIISTFLGLFVLGICGFTANSADAYVSVKGYYKSNGTYVAPHVRSNPNGLKYDNYGYTPSQGLYNKTYGTRGTEWDTPTYITDPNYYQGKAIYNSGSYNYSAPSTYSTTPSCPSNSYYDGISSCKCNYGYVVSGSSCIYKITPYTPLSSNNCPLNSYTSTTDSTKCQCNSGYQTNITKNACVLAPVTTNRARILPHGCVSNLGYSATSGISCNNRK